MLHLDGLVYSAHTILEDKIATGPSSNYDGKNILWYPSTAQIRERIISLHPYSEERQAVSALWHANPCSGLDFFDLYPLFDMHEPKGSLILVVREFRMPLALCIQWSANLH